LATTTYLASRARGGSIPSDQVSTTPAWAGWYRIVIPVGSQIGIETAAKSWKA
jgi:hypothetical protein